MWEEPETHTHAHRNAHWEQGLKAKMQSVKSDQTVAPWKSCREFVRGGSLFGLDISAVKAPLTGSSTANQRRRI